MTASAPTAGSTTAGRPSARRDLMLLLAGAAVSTAGSSVSLLAVTLHLRPLGPAWVAAVTGADLVPMVLLAPLAGQLVDRVRNRQLLVAALAVQGLAVSLAGRVGLDPGRGAVLLVCLAVVGAGATVANPTVSALLPRIAGEDGATRAYGWYAAVSQGGFLIGFAVAGVLVQAFGVRTALLVDAGSYLVMAAGVTLVRTQRHLVAEATPPGPGPGLRAARGRPPSAWSGFGLLRRDRLLRVAVGGLAAAILVGIVVNVAEVFFVLGDLHAGPATLGLVTACWPLAGVGGGWLAGRLRGDRALLAALAASAVVMGAALLLTGWLVTVASLVVAWLLGGTANAAQRVSINALVRSRADDAVRGRVFAATGALLQAANVGGLAVGAVVVAAVGARRSLLLSGLATVLAGGLTWLLARPALARS